MTEKEIEETYYKVYEPIVKLYELLDSGKFSKSEIKRFKKWLHSITQVHTDMVKAIRELRNENQELHKELNEIRKEQQNGNN